MFDLISINSGELVLKKQDVLFYYLFSIDKILECYFVDDYDYYLSNYYLENYLFLYFYLFFYYKYFISFFYINYYSENKEESRDYFYKKKVEQLVLT